MIFTLNKDTKELHRITREYWCDTCGYTSNNEHDFYHNHGKYTAGSSLSILEHRLKHAEDEKEFQKVNKWLEQRVRRYNKKATEIMGR